MLPEDNLKVVENDKTILNHEESKANNNNSNTNDVKSIETSSDVNVNNNKVEEENGITNAIPSPLVVSTNGIEVAEETNSENKLLTVTDTPVEQSNTDTFLPKISQEPKAANSKTQNNAKSVPKARKSGAPVSNAINIKMVNLAPIANMKVKVSDLETALNCDSSKVLDSTKVTSENNTAPSETSSNKGDAKQASSKSKKFKLKKLKKRKSGNYDFPNKKKNYKKKKFEMTSGDAVEQSSEKTLDDSFTNLRTDDKTVNKKVKSGIKSPDRTFMDILSRNNHLAFKRRSKFGCKKVLQSKSFKGKSVMDLLRKNSLSPNSKVKTEMVSPSKDTDSSASGTDLDLSKESVDEENNEQSLATRKRKSEITEENQNIQEESDFSQSTVFLAGKKRKTDESGNMTPIITVVPEVKTSPTHSGLRSLLPPHLQQSSQPNNTADANKPQPNLEANQPITKSKGLAKPMGANAKPSISSLATKNSEALRALLVSGPARGIPRDLSTFNNIVGGFNNNVGKEMKPGLSPNTPNGLTYPVTPPKIPDNDAMNTQCISPDRDIIPLCCCKINGAAFNKLATGNLFCQALDTVDGKVMGCCNKVTNTQLVRPGVKIPFMAICEAHRLKLKAHQCCPGCGHYCTQGKFYQCRKEGPSIHNFHKQCQVFKDGKYFCPHCGEESLQFEVTLSLNDETSTFSDTASTAQGRISKRQTSAASIAKMSLLGGYKEKGSEKETPGVKYSIGSKAITLDSLPSGPDKKTLQKILDNLGQERPKKYRNLSKSLYQPAYDGEIEKCIYILMDGLDPNQRYSEHEDQTAIHAAANSGHLAIVHILVQCGAVVHIQDKTLRTPLMCATENDNKSIIQYLVNAGASVDDRGEDGMTVLHYAAKLGSMAVIQYLVEVRKMSVNITDDGGWTPMIWAAESKYVDTVRYLMSHGADPGMKDDEENTGLHWAAYAGSVDIINLVLSAGCEINVPNEHGDRPLHIAARRSHYECVVLLLARGADVEVKNNEGETPLTVCLDQTSPTWMALKVNKQLKGFAAKRLGRSEKLLHRDVSLGRERNPIACVNAVDDESFPTDYLYIIENVETSPLNINRVITSLQSCRCKDDCSSMFCVCARSTIKCWYDKMGRVVSDFNIVEPPLVFECNRACRCWTNCNNRVVQNGITARLQLFRTNGRGWGVRALTDIPKGSFICEYIGELISDCEADRREDDSYLFDLDNKDGETYCIDARKYGNIARFINHLCEPNVIPVKVFVEHQDLRFPRICFFSSRDIKAHEELGFDYGEKFWIIKWKQFTCTCESVKCKYSKDTIQKTLTDYRLRHGVEDTGLDTPPATETTDSAAPPPPAPSNPQEL
ncbi:hypothetical protein SNE40_000564 [Patella caerulea]